MIGRSVCRPLSTLFFLSEMSPFPLSFVVIFPRCFRLKLQLCCLHWLSSDTHPETGSSYCSIHLRWKTITYVGGQSERICRAHTGRCYTILQICSAAARKVTYLKIRIRTASNILSLVERFLKSKSQPHYVSKVEEYRIKKIKTASSAIPRHRAEIKIYEVPRISSRLGKRLYKTTSKGESQAERRPIKPGAKSR